ncbi:hypothetical protein E4U42_004288 [Claviceps africana]|uniref:Transmembrane protein n=1 Tax=Claviceps africana TaxID=83212 RepID=A0A8K0NI70_9HYPO|nr:hypothetical protein E4U42_004288 [Claviceps africana]
MDVERPIQYPPRVAVRKTDNDNESLFHGSDASTATESEFPFKRTLPHQEAAKARRIVKQELCIRLMASIFVTLLVSVTVAAAVTRMFEGDTQPSLSSNQTLDLSRANNTHTWNGTSFTMYSSANKSTSTLPGEPTTSASLHSWKTGLADMTAKQHSTPTAYQASARTTAGVKGTQTLDCASAGLFAHASLITGIMPTATRTPQANRRQRERQKRSSAAGKANGADDQIVGVSIYVFRGCLLIRSVYKSSEAAEDMVFKCSLLCRGKKLEMNQACHAAAEEWGACG